MQKRSRVRQRFVRHGDGADGGADAGADDAELAVALLRQPLQAAPGIHYGLAIRLQRQADVGSDKRVGALMAGDGAAVVVGHGQTEDGDAHAI